MERNQIIGFVLIFVIIMVWSVLNRPEELSEVAHPSAIPTQVDTNVLKPVPDVVVTRDSLPLAENDLSARQYGVFAPGATGVEEEVILENDKMIISFSNKGGRIKYVEFKDYYKIIEDENGEEKKSKVRLFEDSKNKFNYRFPSGSKVIRTEDLFFESTQARDKVSFRLNTTEGGYFLQTYQINPESYQVDYSIQFHGLGNDIQSEQGSVQLEIENYLDQIEKNNQFERRYSTVYYKEVNENSDYCSCTGDDEDDLQGHKIEWVSFVHQFFNTSILAHDTPFNGLVATTQLLGENSDDLKKTTALLQIPYLGSQDESFAMKMFIGPNEYKLLKAYDNDLEEIIPFGRSIFGDINRHVIRPFFDWLSQYIGSKGIVIIVLIFIIKMVLYPLTYKMLHSQAKMGVLKPELAKLKDRFKDDMQKQQMETMKVYREYGVSPFGGCMPMVVQMPIWYALFRFFPASITFRQEPFLWAADLSSYDVFLHLPVDIPSFGSHLSLFTVLWAITTVIYTYYNMRHMDMTTNPAMKYVQYFMPVMFFVFFNNYASGLTCYMFFSNLMNIGQTILTKKFIFNDEKILAELNEQKKKPKKKGSFQARLEQAMKQQQKTQELRKVQEKKKKK